MRLKRLDRTIRRSKQEKLLTILLISTLLLSLASTSSSVMAEDTPKLPDNLNEPFKATVAYYYGVSFESSSTNDHTTVQTFWFDDNGHLYLAFTVHDNSNQQPQGADKVKFNGIKANVLKIYPTDQKILKLDDDGEEIPLNLSSLPGKGTCWAIALFKDFLLKTGSIPVNIECEQPPFSIDSTITITKQDITIEKVWEDKIWERNNGDPPIVTIHLFKNGEDEPTKSLTLSEEDDWKGVFKDVEMAHVNKGKVETYNYYIKEEKINGYDSSIVGDAYNGFIVTNTPSKGELVIKKVDDQGNTITDSPATFTLYQEDEAKYTATTDQGVAKFEGVLPGVYSLMETQAPRGYEPDPTIYTVIADLNEEGEVELRVLDSEENILDNHPLIITNTLMRAELIVEKVDDGGDTITQNPATFVLKQGGDIKDTQQTRADGKAIFTGLLPGTYTLEEVQAPEGYERDATIFTIEVRLDKNGKIVVLAGDTIITADNPLKVTNTILGTLTIKKEIGEGDGQHDPNQTFVFEIKQYEVMENGSKGAFVRTFYETIRVNSGSGSKTIIDLPRGYYEVTEKSDWSWQYEADGPMVKGGALGLQGKSSIETSFTNTPKKVSWLTSIDWVINLFTGGDN